jgi:Kazal-type serine protease inhibitor domain
MRATIQKLLGVFVGLTMMAGCAVNTPGPTDEERIGEESSMEKARFCGGIAGISCKNPNEICIDDPNDNCDPNQGGADCGGICVKKKEHQFCGGIAGIPCKNPNEICIDDPNDNCDPNQGGADCGGICVKKTHCDGKSKHCKDPSRTYVSHDPRQCQVILFLCVEGQQPFSDECGCGCEPVRICGGLTGAQCKAGEYCSFAPEAQCGAADQTGVCEVRPTGCTKEYRPVCGCDDRTYGNACMAAAAGISVASDGPCVTPTPGSCGTRGGVQCAADEYCSFPASSECGANDGAGSCMKRPEVCIDIFKPVCGCDGHTYSNACFAAGAGVSVASEGACAP